MVAASTVRIDRGRVEELAAKEQKRLDDSTQKSGEMYEWARKTLAGGVEGVRGGARLVPS